MVITTDGRAPRGNIRLSRASGSGFRLYPGSTRSTATEPWYRPNMLGSTQTTPSNALGSQTAPAPLPWPEKIDHVLDPSEACCQRLTLHWVDRSVIVTSFSAGGSWC